MEDIDMASSTNSISLGDDYSETCFKEIAYTKKKDNLCSLGQSRNNLSEL